jgi:hypothetical protein
MTTYQQQYPSSSGGGGRLQQRQSGDFRMLATSGANGNGPLPVPTGPQNRANNGTSGGMRPSGHFEGARSPPNNKSRPPSPADSYRQFRWQS